MRPAGHTTSEELADHHPVSPPELHRGLFLPACTAPDYTTELMIRALRPAEEYRFNGYIHAKAISARRRSWWNRCSWRTGSSISSCRQRRDFDHHVIESRPSGSMGRFARDRAGGAGIPPRPRFAPGRAPS